MAHSSKYYGHSVGWRASALGFLLVKGAACCVAVLTLLLGVSTVSAQVAGSTAEIQHLDIVHDGDNLRIEVTLSAPTEPQVTVASDPDRLVLELPNTTAEAKQRRIPVNWKGITRVRVGLNSVSPPVTRVVVDLDRAHGYTLNKTNRTIVLTVLPQEGGPITAPAPATSGSVLGPLLGRSRASGGDAKKKSDQKQDSARRASQQNGVRTAFRVKAIAQDEVYLDGGSRSGLAAGMKLVIHDAGPSSNTGTPQGPDVAELRIVSVAENTAVTSVQNPQRDVKPGDWAYLSAEDAAVIIAAASKKAGSDVPVNNVVEERSNLQSIQQASDQGHMRGRIGFDTSGFRNSGSTPGRSNTVGFMVRSDMTKILGTHWNLQGYWRTRFTSSTQPLQQTMEYYLDKAYTIQLYYDNPDSKWVGGIGRLYLPWATVLDTIDGAYVGRKVSNGITAATFFGSVPDINTWHYSPNQRIGGGLVNFDGGSYDSFHYSSTVGGALDTVKWRLERPYGFLENKISYKGYFSAYHTFVVDDQQGLTTNGITPGAGVSRSYLTVHVQPFQRIGFDVVHNYFRDVPTLSTALISTGMVDKLIYQGVIGIAHLQATRHLTLYTDFGHGKKTGDGHRSLDQVFGVTWSDLGRRNTHVDYHYSKFASPFATGHYQMLSFSRYFTNRVLWDMQVGHQDLVSTFTANTKQTYVDTSFDTDIGRHSYVQSGYTYSRGNQLNYYQWYLSIGYRFDGRSTIKRTPELAPEQGNVVPRTK